MQGSFQPIWFCYTQIGFALQPAQQVFHLKSKTDAFMGLERNIWRNGEEHLIFVRNNSTRMNSDHFVILYAASIITFLSFRPPPR